MKNINSCHTLFFESVSFQEKLVIEVEEGFRSTISEPIIVSDKKLGQGYKIEPSESSRKFSVCFDNPVCWQVVDESFTTKDDYEVFEHIGLLSVLNKSEYLDYVNSLHGFYKDIIGEGKHYRLWTEDQVIDVISTKEPDIVQK